MYARVSTISLTDYLSAFTFPQAIFVGKKFEGEFKTQNQYNTDGIIYSLTSATKYLTGWINEDFSFPEYKEWPKNLPDYVSKSHRFLIGDGCALGPFTLPQALYIHSVVRKIIPQGELTPTATAGGFSPNLGPSTEEDIYESYLYHDNSYPELNLLGLGYRSEQEAMNKALFFARAKEGVFFGRDSGPSSDAIIGFQSYPSFNFYTNDPLYFDFDEGGAIIIMDIDKPSDFYIGNINFAISCYSSGADTKSNEQEYTNEAGNTVTARSSSYLYKGDFVTLSVQRENIAVPSGSEDSGGYQTKNLNSVGDSSTATYSYEEGTPAEGTYSESKTTNYTYIKEDIEFDFGLFSKTISFYGLRTSSETREKTEHPQAPVDYGSVSVNAPSSGLSFKASSFWPYKTSNGKPVYDKDTGKILNSPFI